MNNLSRLFVFCLAALVLPACGESGGGGGIGAIDIVSTPAGAAIFLDGIDTGQVTPYTLTDIAAGNHALRLTLNLYNDDQRTVSVSNAQTASVNVTMTRCYYFLDGTWGGYGAGDGQFKLPYGIARDGSGNFYVADYWNYRIQKFDSSMNYLSQWGSAGTGDGQFSCAIDVAVDAGGNVYVVDQQLNRVQKFNSGGGYVTKWGGTGTSDGQFDEPSCICVDSGGNVYVTDSKNYRVQKFSSTGTFLLKWGGYGSADDQFLVPRGICYGIDGNIYVTDTSLNCVKKFNAASGAFVGKWGSLGDADGQFNYPGDVFMNSEGFIFVADYINNRVQIFNTSTAIWTRFSCESPTHLVADASRNVYVIDFTNDQVKKYRYQP